MKKRFLAVILSNVIAVSVFMFLPLKTYAAEEYLVRDKWGFCTTQNYAESEHFVIFYGNNDTTGMVNDAFIKKNLDYYEKYWHCYGEYLGMENMNVDIYGRSSQKYKTNVYLTYTGLPRSEFAEGWAFMSSEDGYGIEIISPEAMLDAGVAYATEQIIDLFANGVNAVHLYTMNKPEVAERIMANLRGILASDDR